MGGTFDPIHLGHLRAAENVREGLGLDEVLFVPAHVPPHRNGPQSSPLDRYAMVSLATASHPGFVPSDVELRRDGPSYTLATLEGLKAARPKDELFLIVGSDTVGEMKTWRGAEQIFSLCRVAVASRPGDDAGEAPGRFEVVAGPGLPISATEVRRRVRDGQSVRFLVPEAVALYIEKRGLYR